MLGITSSWQSYWCWKSGSTGWMVHHIYLLYLPRDSIHEKTHGPSIVDLIQPFALFQGSKNGNANGSVGQTAGVGSIPLWRQDMYKLHDATHFSDGLVQDITHYSLCTK